MNRGSILLLGLLGLLVALGVACLQEVPGYMDADYYQAGGKQLASGKGFNEPYLWNYLDDPSGLPHPSHAYWMPMASLLAAIVPALFGSTSFFLSRIPFYVAAACIPPVTARLAYSLSSRRSHAIAAGLLAVFSGFYLPFLVTTDTFALYMLFGGLFFLLLNRKQEKTAGLLWYPLLTGMLAGLMHLSRADGLLWLLLGLAACWLFPKSGGGLRKVLMASGATLSGYLLVMAPWFARNLSAFGAVLAPGGSRMLWLTSYDQLFSYPASQLTFQSWWGSGVPALLGDRAWALGMNLATFASVQGGILLLPLILTGAWTLRQDKRVRMAGLGWLITFLVMTVVFPFAGARGGFFHSGAAVQPLLWALEPTGLERLLEWGRERRGWKLDQARPVFLAGTVLLMVIVTGAVLLMRLPGWKNEATAYSQINAALVLAGMEKAEVVMLSNPPGFHLVAGNPAIAVPDGDVETIFALAERYEARYLVLEPGSVPDGLLPVLQNPEAFPGLTHLGEVAGASVFSIQTEQSNQP